MTPENQSVHAQLLVHSEPMKLRPLGLRSLPVVLFSTIRSCFRVFTGTSNAHNFRVNPSELAGKVRSGSNNPWKWADPRENGSDGHCAGVTSLMQHLLIRFPARQHLRYYFAHHAIVFLMIKFAKLSPSLRSGAGQPRSNCFHVERRSRLEVRSAFSSCGAGQNAENSPYSVRFWYPDYADSAAFDCHDGVRLHTGEAQFNDSHQKAYVGFPFRIKILERGSEQFSL